jgi:GTP-binding protein LepA
MMHPSLLNPNRRQPWDLDFRCGFLGLLHMEIMQERLEREYDMNVITTVPNVSYNVLLTNGTVVKVYNPSGLPNPSVIDTIEEPFIRASIITSSEFIGSIMNLCLDKRGMLVSQNYLNCRTCRIGF